VILTQSLPKSNFVCFWLFCFSSVYESELSPQPKTKKAFPIAREGFVALIRVSLEEFAEDVRAILDAKLKCI